MTNQASEDELYERIERLFDLRISSSGADIGIGFKTSRERSGSDRTWVDYEEWLELRQSIESLIRTEKAKEHNCGHNLVDWDGDGHCITCARDKIADPLGDMFEAMGVDVIDITPKEVK